MCESKQSGDQSQNRPLIGTIGYRNVLVENNIETEVDNNDTSITNDVLVWNSGRNTSTISSVEVSIGDAVYQTDGSGSLSSSETSVQSSDSRPLVVVGVAAHTIGHREITIINNSTIGDDNNDNNSYDASNDGTDSGSNANLSTIGVADTFTGSTVSESNEIRQLVSIRGRFSD